MSWSVQYIGTPDKLIEALNKYSDQFTDPKSQSKLEFEEALPSLKKLLLLNVGESIFRITANGHATFDGEGKKLQGYCSVNIEQLYGALV